MKFSDDPLCRIIKENQKVKSRLENKSIDFAPENIGGKP